MIDARRLRAVATLHGTPTYVYDLDAIERRVRELRAALPERVDLAYAVKANPCPAVMRAIAATGIGADVASAGEVHAARAAGFAPSATVLTGPGKRDDELALAAGASLRAVTVESLGELERLVRAARAARTRVPVLLRAAADDRAGGNLVTGSSGRFGMRPADLVAAARIAAASEHLELAGVHRFPASNVLDARRLVRSATETVELAARLAATIERPLRLVDLGGGLGIPYAAGEGALDVGTLAHGLERLVRRVDADRHLAGAQLVLEPGRFLVGPFGAFVTRVVDVKEGGAGLVVTVDGGVHHLLRPALVRRAHRVRLLHRRGDARACVVGGPLCTGLDVLARATLPAPRVGDLVAIDDVGAYGYTQSMPLFLSHPWPAEVVLRGAEARLARRRLDPAELAALAATG